MGFWETFKQKFSSRKFLMALGTAFFTIFNEGLGWGIPSDVYWWVWGIAVAYILGEAYVDGKREG